MEQWKRFNFVDKEAVLEVEGKKKVTPRALRDFEPCCSCGGRGRLVFGDKKGRVRVVDTDMRQTHGVQAFSGRVVAVAQPAVLKAYAGTSQCGSHPAGSWWFSTGSGPASTVPHGRSGAACRCWLGTWPHDPAVGQHVCAG